MNFNQKVLFKIDSWSLSDQKIFASFESMIVFMTAFTAIVVLAGVSFENKLFALVWFLMWIGLGVKHLILKQEEAKSK